MQIWSSEIKELESLYASLKGKFPELEKELEQLTETKDANVILIYSRRCLEVIITDLCEKELKRPRKTEPLKGIIDKLSHEDKVPSHIIVSMQYLNSLSTFGAHPKDFDPEQIKPVLSNLIIINKWYLKYKDAQTITKAKTGEEQAIREIIREEQKDEGKSPDVLQETIRKPIKSILLLSFGLLLIAAIIAYPKIFRQDRFEQLKSSGGKISVAVMPFQNMTNDTIWNIWQDGIKDNLITYLSNFPEDLSVRPIESINGLLQNQGLTNYSSISPSVASTISQKLDANVFISGSISQAGGTVRVNAQLINSKTEEPFQSFQIEGTSEGEIFQIIDSLSALIKNFLIISVMEKEIFPDFRQLISTRSAEAYKYYMYGNQVFYKFDYPTAREWYLKAIDIDTNFTEPIRMLSYSYLNVGLYEEGKKWCLRLYEKMDQMSIIEKLYANAQYAGYFETPYERIKYWKLLEDYDDQMPVPYSNTGGAYMDLNQYDKAINEFEKELEIYKKWDSRPRWSLSYTALGKLYHLTGQYRKEKKLYKKAERDFPDDYNLLYRQAILSLTERDTSTANPYIDQFISARKISSVSEAAIASDLSGIYSEAGILDKAEIYLRVAQSLEPTAPERMDQLAFFLIDKERNINEGLELVGTALKSDPDNYKYLHTEGWGLYKQDKYREALEILQKSWDLRRKYAIYNYEAYLHLEEVKKAVADQKNK